MRNKWAKANAPAALKRRRLAADARRLEIAARVVDRYTHPEPGALWQTVTVSGSLRIDLYVPRGRARCDQHAARVNGVAVPMLSATEIGRMVARAIRARPSAEVVAEIRRDEWAEAIRVCPDSSRPVDRR